MAPEDTTHAAHPFQGIMRPSLVLFQLILVVLIPAALTLRTVRVAVGQPSVADDPTPLGYTWSLLLFIIPLLYLAFWFLLHPRYKIQKKIFTITLAVLTPLGIVLDLLSLPIPSLFLTITGLCWEPIFQGLAGGFQSKSSCFISRALCLFCCSISGRMKCGWTATIYPIPAKRFRFPAGS